MYNDGFVLSIVCSGKTNREYSKDGKSVVYLPFGSEYSIRVKSKVSNKCKADVFIDGTNISNIGSFVISPYGSLDIERFLGADISKGRKFKFESVNNVNVQDPNSCENGLVEVYIYREKVVTWAPITWTYNGPWEYPYNSREKKGSSGDRDFVRYDTNTCSNYVNSNSFNSDSYTAFASCDTQEGATVEGSKSSQSFIQTGSFDVEDTPIILRVKIMGVTQYNDIVEYCTKCGKKRNRGNNYCGKCGFRFSR